MTSDHLTDAADMADALRLRMRSGQGLSVPYARKWDVGGCQATHSLRTYPYDGILVFSTGLASLGQPITPTDDGLLIGDSPVRYRCTALVGPGVDPPGTRRAVRRLVCCGW